MKKKKSPGVAFSEHMGGYISKDAKDYHQGYFHGRNMGIRVDFWVSIKIMDMKKFLENPHEVALMSGRVSAGTLGENLEIKLGEFNMFRGEKDSDLKHVAYKFEFASQNGELFYFSGIKNIRLRKEDRSSRDAVTLYSRIYKGHSEDGDVFGSGILLFNTLKDGPGLLSSIRISNASSIGEKLATLRMFMTSTSAKT